MRVDLERDVVIRGAVRVERTARGLLPRRATVEAFGRIPDDFMRATVGQSAGIRLAFRTAARTLTLHVRALKTVESAATPPPAAIYDLTRDGGVVASAASSSGPLRLFSFERPVASFVAGPDATLRFDVPAGDDEYELWLPYTDEVELLALTADAPVTPPRAPAAPRWVHHGSSISHGYLASRTTRTWPVLAAQRLGLELTNLAYSGNALLDQLTARTIRDTPADRISVKLGINVVNGDMMRARIFRSAVHGFLDTVRDGHPTTPLLVLSPICCPPVEQLPGPTVFERTDPPWVTTAGHEAELAQGKLSLAIIRETLAEVVADRARDDPAIGVLDGARLYGLDDNARMPLPDNLHPGDDVNALIAARFAALAAWPGTTRVVG